MLETLILVLLILINGLFAMSELAVVSSRRARLESLRRDGHRGAGVALTLMEDPTRFLSTVQIGITLVGVLAGAFGGVSLGERLGAWLNTFPSVAPHGGTIAIGSIVLVVTYATLVVGELVPKRLALRRPERIAIVVAPAMQQLARLASPVVWLLKVSTEGMLGIVGAQGGREPAVTEEEVRMLIAEGTRSGVFVARERDMLEGVLRLADRRVRAIMTPRHEVAWLDEGADAAELAEQLATHRASRYPVCRDSIDHPVGIVHVRDLVPALLKGQPIALADYIARPLIVPEGVHVLRLLESFRSEGVHMAIVVDEYGATEGIVTLADILGAIAGDLPERGEEGADGLVHRSDGTWLVDGGFPIDEFEYKVKLTGLHETGEFDTVAGFVLHQLERLPSEGESFYAFGGRFEVVDMDGHRIDKVLYEPAAAAGTGGAGAAHAAGGADPPEDAVPPRTSATARPQRGGDVEPSRQSPD